MVLGTIRRNGDLMVTTIVISSISLAIGFAGAWQLLSRRLQTVQQELREVEQQLSSQTQPDVRNLLQEILDVASRMDGDVGRHTLRVSEVSNGIQQALNEQPGPIVQMTQQLLDANAKLRDELHAARKQISCKQQELEVFVSEARTDMLTGLKNRRSFNEELNRYFAQRQRQGVVFSLIMIDIDHFKRFNDVHGHLSGDLVLRSVAQVLSATVREMDVVCRYGGEEFAVICPGSRLREAAIAAERIREAVAGKKVSLKDGNAQVTISLGAAEVGSAEIAEGLIQRADEALYAAKHNGRDRVHLHNGDDGITALSDAAGNAI